MGLVPVTCCDAMDRTRIPPKMQPQVRDFKPYTAGLSVEDIQSRHQLNRVIKLSSNENPLGMSPLVQRSIQQYAALGFRYPRAGSPKLTQALADFYSLPQDRLLVCNGSDEAIDLLIRVLARPGKDHLLVCDPCFSMYELQAKLCGVAVRRVPLNPDFSFPWEVLLSRVDETTALVFITNPDNPSGFAAFKDEILQFAEQLPASCYLVLDEAYIEFADAPEQCSPLQEWQSLPQQNLIILRTFSKMYGLAGLRVGYGILPPEVREFLLRVKSPFSVNLLAEQAALTALQDQEFTRLTGETVQQGRSYLSQELTRLGSRVFPSQANFVMFQPPGSAQALFEALLQQGIILRPLSSYGLEDCLRVSIGTMPENQALIQAMEQAYR